MDIRSLILNAFWLAFAPLLDEASLDGWTHADAPPADTRSLEGVSPAWWPETADFDWRRSRELAAGMACQLGVVALALVDCEAWTAVDAASPDINDIHRRSAEERLRSI